MNDLFRREKFAHLPRAISKEGKAMHTYEVGDVAHWPPGPDVAIVIVVVVVVSDGFARMGAPLQPRNSFPGGSGSAVSDNRARNISSASAAIVDHQSWRPRSGCVRPSARAAQ